MAFLGWLEYDGVELWFDERVLFYLDAAGCDGVEGETAGIAAMLGVQLGDAPSSAGGNGSAFAPWVGNGVNGDLDAFFRGLYGFVGLALDGVTRSPRKRSVTPAVSGGGGTPGPDYADPREIEARVAVVAADEESAQWGVDWLADVLTYGRPVAAGGPRWGNPPRPGGLAGALRLFTDGAAGTDALRTLYDVVLTEGPAVEDTHVTGGGLVVFEVSMTLTAAVPYFYRPARQLAVNTPLAAYPNAYTGTGSPVTWVMTRDRAAVVRGADTDQCGAGPLSGCPDPVTVPAPVQDTDACAATTPHVPRFALLVNTAEAFLPARQETVPVIVVDTGGAIMRRFSVRIGRRQSGYDAAGAGLMWEINVPFLPANARLILDGRTGTAVVHCSGSYLSSPGEAIDLPAPASTYEPAVYGIRSGPVVWPVWQGGEDLQITAHAEDDFCAGDAAVALYLASRTDTA